MNSSGQGIGNIQVRPTAFSNPGLANSTAQKLSQNPLLLNENLSRRIDSQSRQQHIKETFDLSLSSIDKFLDARISTLNELSAHQFIGGPAQSLEWVKVRDEIQSYLNGTRSFIHETAVELDNILKDVKQQKDALSASDYLALKGEAQALVAKNAGLQKLFEKIERGSASGTIH